MSDRPLQLAASARERAAKLRRLAKQAEAVTWRPEAVMRENASLLLTLSGEIERLSTIADAAEALIEDGGFLAAPSSMERLAAALAGAENGQPGSDA